MILADTSIWVDHLAREDPVMAARLGAGAIVIHPFVMGEVAMGSLARRAAVLFRLRTLPQAPVADLDEVSSFVEREKLFGTGIGYVDAHLLASTLLMPGATLWTRDKRLRAAAERLGVGAGE